MMNVLNSLNQSLKEAMKEDSKVILIGEDLLDPYGGAFKVSKGLSSSNPGQVFTTPISEAAIVGIGIGMAIRGLRPIVEIMFGDFLTLAADQIINHAAKFPWIYDNKVEVPIVIRTPMGGRRGYGPTHSQSLEKLFLGIPELKILAPNTLNNPGDLLKRAIKDNEPVIFIEHKLIYSSLLQEINAGELVDADVEIIDQDFPISRIKFTENPKVTIATYGYNFEIVRKASLELLYEKEIETEIVLFSQLNQKNLDPLFDSIKKTRKFITFEEGTVRGGWGAEILARIQEENLGEIKSYRIGALDYPIANSIKLEEVILPSKNYLKEKICEFLNM